MQNDNVVDFMKFKFKKDMEKMIEGFCDHMMEEIPDLPPLSPEDDFDIIVDE